MRPVGKTTRKHRRQQANGKPRHKLIGGRTGQKAYHQLKNFQRGKAAKAEGKPRDEHSYHDNPPALSAIAFKVED